jgi:hypothetical protein
VATMGNRNRDFFELSPSVTPFERPRQETTQVVAVVVSSSFVCMPTSVISSSPIMPPGFVTDTQLMPPSFSR